MNIITINEKIVWKHGWSYGLNRNLFVILNFFRAAQGTGDYFKNMALSEGNQPFAGDLHVFLDEINAYMFKVTQKWSWKWIVQHQGQICGDLPAKNISSAPKYVHFQGWSLKFK